MTRVYSCEKSPSTAANVEVLETAKNTGFSELSTSALQEPDTCLKSALQESYTSDEPVGGYFVELARNTSSLKGKERIPLAESIYRELLPCLIRRMKGTPLGNLDVDDDRVVSVFESWFENLRENASRAGMNIETGLQYSESVFVRFSAMWQQTLFPERDWLELVRMLIVRRQQWISALAGQYPVELQELEVNLLKRNIRVNATEAAAVLLCWEMQRESQDGTFFLSRRKAGELSAAIVSRELRDVNHADVIGRAVIEKLKRLKIIELVQSGTSYKATGRKDAKATTYRWCFVPQEISEDTAKVGSTGT